MCDCNESERVVNTNTVLYQAVFHAKQGIKSAQSQQEAVKKWMEEECSASLVWHNNRVQHPHI